MKFKFTLVALLVALSLMAATIIKKTSEYPNVTTPGTNDLFLLALTNAPATNHNIKYSDLKASINATNLTLSVNGTNATTPNLQDSATVTWSKSGSNLTATAAGGDASAPVNNFYTTNNYFVTGKGATLIITNYVRFPPATLTLSGTNVSTINVSSNSTFKLTLTTNAFIGAPTGLPGTNLIQGIQIFVQQDSVGGWTLTWTNATWKFAGGTAPTMTTTTNAIDVFTFASSPFSATQLYGVPAQDIR